MKCMVDILSEIVYYLAQEETKAFRCEKQRNAYFFSHRKQSVGKSKFRNPEMRIKYDQIRECL